MLTQAAADDHVIGMEVGHLSALTRQINYQGIPYSEDEDICTTTQQDCCIKY